MKSALGILVERPNLALGSGKVTVQLAQRNVDIYSQEPGDIHGYAACHAAASLIVQPSPVFSNWARSPIIRSAFFTPERS